VPLDVGNRNHQADQKLTGAGIRFHFRRRKFIMPALAAASASTPMRRGVGLWSHMQAPLSVELSAFRNQKGTTINNMTNIKLIALIAGAAVLAGAPALILPRILRAPRPRRSRPDSMRKNGKIPNSKNSMTAFRRPHAIPA